MAGEIVGTPAYMSPEQARGEAVDERSDLYSLCVLFHELLCLRHPLEGKQTLKEMLDGVIHDAAPMAGLVTSPHQPRAPMDLSWFVRKGLAKHPANRYQSAQEMIDRLARRAEGEVRVQCQVTLMRKMTVGATRFVDRSPFLASAVFFTTVIAAGAGIVAAVAHALG
jgi:serine/threonine-protein kinase